MWAIVTDIHANREAFSQVLADAHDHGASGFAFLGDLVGYGADPAWVVDTIMGLSRSHPVLTVMGNHDEAAVNGARPSMRVEARQAIDWTRACLNPEQLGFLAQLPYTIEHEQMLLVHANAYAPSQWGYVLGIMEAYASLNATTARWSFCGHVHHSSLYCIAGNGRVQEFSPHPDEDLPLGGQRRWLVLPGSCGQPRDGNPAACYGLFDPKKATFHLRRVAYDHHKAAQKIRQAGLPSYLADRLLLGQ